MLQKQETDQKKTLFFCSSFSALKLFSLHPSETNLNPRRFIFLSSLTNTGRLQIISSQESHYGGATAENLPQKSVDWFQKQTKDEDKRPDRRAVLVNTRDKSWRSSSLRDEQRLENHS